MARKEVEDWFWQFGDIHRLTEEIQPGRPRVLPSRSWEPRVDVIEEEDRILVKVEIAGVRGEDTQLIYVPDRHALLLRGVREEQESSDGNRIAIHQLEIFYGSFQREIALPGVTIDASNIKAQYRNGFLMIIVPKVERTVAVMRSITIRDI